MGNLFSSRFLIIIAGVFIVSSGLSFAFMTRDASLTESLAPQVHEEVDVDVAIDQALEYSVNGVYGKSFPILKSLADQDITRAKLYLAVAYYHGQGVEKNRGKAKELFLALLDKGYENGIVTTYLSLIGYSEF